MSSDLRKKLMQSGLPPRMPLSLSHPGGGPTRGGRRQRNFTPVHWSSYFSNHVSLAAGGNSFSVYTHGDLTTGPLLVLLHGGGYSALTWAPLAVAVAAHATCGVLAMDLRGHGDSAMATEEQECDLSAETMAGDVCQVVAVAKDVLLNGRAPDILLVGHSMGGALAVHVALRGEIENLAAVCVIDVVEGTAMDALSSMQSFLHGRPKTFRSLPQAVEWAVRSGQVHNVEAARVSVPGQLKSTKTCLCATAYVKKGEDAVSTSTDKDNVHHPLPPANDSIAEEDDEKKNEEADGKAEKRSAEKFTRPDSKEELLTWRVDLTRSECHWPGWFSGLSSKFLSVPASKLLLLAGVDRLDRELTVGQMQGKFQMQVLAQTGHAVHEDQPDKVASILATFMIRNKLAEPIEDFKRTFPAC